MSRARDLSKLGNPNVIKADTANNVGFGTQTPLDPANSGNTNIVSAGIVTAAKFFGDGSGLDGVASAGLGTAVDDTKDSIGQNIYYTNQELSIYENTTVNAPATSDVAYTQYSQVTVEDGKELIVADGDTFIPDVLGIGTGLQAVAAGAGNGLFGTVYVDNIENVAGRGGPNLPLGMTVSGIATFSGNVSIGGTLTYEDVTNVDSVGVVTARSGVDINAGGLDITAGGVNVGGISTLGGNVNIAGNAQFTVASPQLEFNNGGPRLWSPSANTLTIHTGGGFGSTTNERLRIGSAGQIGLGGANYGTTGQVLTSQGASAAPQWADAGGGEWTLLGSSSGDISNGTDTIDITTTLITSTYYRYKVVFNLNCDYNIASGKMGFRVRVNNSWESAAYYRTGYRSTGGSMSNAANSYALLVEDDIRNLCGEIILWNPSTASNRPHDMFMSGFALNNRNLVNSSGYWVNQSYIQVDQNNSTNYPITGIQFRTQRTIVDYNSECAQRTFWVLYGAKT